MTRAGIESTLLLRPTGLPLIPPADSETKVPCSRRACEVAMTALYCVGEKSLRPAVGVGIVVGVGVLSLVPSLLCAVCIVQQIDSVKLDVCLVFIR